LKDVQYGLRLAQTLKIGAPFAALADLEFAALCELSGEESNESRIFEIARSKTHEKP
jgi:hypothetical protein